MSDIPEPHSDFYDTKAWALHHAALQTVTPIQPMSLSGKVILGISLVACAGVWWLIVAAVYHGVRGLVG